MKRTVIITILVCVLLGGIYLNRAYAHIYNAIDNENLASTLFDYTEVISMGSEEDTPISYVALGDSLTYGVGASSIEHTFPYLFASTLAVDNKKVELSNLGTPGAKVNNIISEQLDRALELQPDYVTILIGTNDMHGFISYKKFSEDLGHVLQTVTTHTNAHITLITVPYLGSKKLILPPYQYFFDYRIKKYNQVIEKLGDTYTVQVVDLYSTTRESFLKNQTLYSSDGLHPSDEGYSYWSQSIYAN